MLHTRNGAQDERDCFNAKALWQWWRRCQQLVWEPNEPSRSLPELPAATNLELQFKLRTVPETMECEFAIKLVREDMDNSKTQRLSVLPV